MIDTHFKKLPETIPNQILATPNKQNLNQNSFFTDELINSIKNAVICGIAFTFLCKVATWPSIDEQLTRIVNHDILEIKNHDFSIFRSENKYFFSPCSYFSMFNPNTFDFDQISTKIKPPYHPSNELDNSVSRFISNYFLPYEAQIKVPISEREPGMFFGSNIKETKGNRCNVINTHSGIYVVNYPIYKSFFSYLIGQFIPNNPATIESIPCSYTFGSGCY